jgi:hypothetical protein
MAEAPSVGPLDSCMNIEYFHEGSDDCPLILIYGTEQGSWRALQEGIRSLLEGKIKDLAIHELSGFVPIDGCQLVAKLGTWNSGIKRIGAGNIFECVLTKIWWDNNEGLIDPFSTKTGVGGFQFLEAGSGNIGLIISTFRGW